MPLVASLRCDQTFNIVSQLPLHDCVTGLPND